MRAVYLCKPKRKADVLLQKYALEDDKSIILNNEKIFTVKEKFNKKNDRIHVKNVKDITISHKKSLRVHKFVKVIEKADVYWKRKPKFESDIFN